MKSIQKTVLLAFLLTGLQFALSSCVGVVGVDGGVVYGDRPWFGDGVWLDGGGRGWYGGHDGGGYVHPGGGGHFRR